MENSIVMKRHGKMCNFSVESDIRPGLLYSNKQRRDHNLYKKKQTTSRPFKEMADEKRNDGLNTAIPETNKGFMLLKKMGYKPGSGVGKLEAGSCQPIALEIREDKSGLGHETDRKEKLNTLSRTSFSMYRTAMKKRKELSDSKYDYARVQRACQYFDSEDGLQNPLKKWFWPRSVDTPKVDEDKVQSDSETGRKSPLLEQNPSSTDTEVPDSDEECKNPTELLTGDEIEWRVSHIVIYLREKYNYCIWCGFQFDDEKDMEKMCPGRTRQDHDETSRHVESDHYDSN